MKTLFFFGTKLYVYLIELPFIYLLILTLNHNSKTEGAFKLYPLIVFSILAMIFIAVYFFNAVTLNRVKIRQIGLFSSRDKVMINKGKSLVITYLSYNKLRLEIYDFQEFPSLNISREDFVPTESCIFRERIIGSNRTASKILRYFGATREQVDELIFQNEKSFSTKSSDFSTRIHEDRKQIKIKFNETV